MGQGGHVPEYLDRGYIITSVPPQYFRSQVKLSLFVDYMAFYFAKTHVLL